MYRIVNLEVNVTSRISWKGVNNIAVKTSFIKYLSILQEYGYLMWKLLIIERRL